MTNRSRRRLAELKLCAICGVNPARPIAGTCTPCYSWHYRAAAMTQGQWYSYRVRAEHRVNLTMARLRVGR